MIGAAASRRPEFARGWPVLVSSAFGNGCGMAALPVYGLSTFLGPLSAEFGWEKGAIGIAATIVTLGIFVTGPIVGWLCDRYGVRRIALPSVLLLAAALAGLSLIDGSIRNFYFGYALVAIGGAATTSVAYSRVVNGWFERNRGLALGLMMTGSGVAAVILPLFLSAIIADWGWRAAWLALGVVALLPLPLMLPLLRDPPRDPHVEQVVHAGLTFGEALRRKHFWLLAISAMIFSSAMGGFIVHVVPMLAELGLAKATVARYAALMGVGMIAGRLGAGFLLDRLSGPPVAAGLMVATAFGFILLAGPVMWAVPLAIFLIGLSLGAEGDLVAFFTARYCGLKHYAVLFGWLFGIIALGTAAGPVLIRYLDGDGYRLAQLVFAGQCVVAAGLMLSLGRYPDGADTDLRSSNNGSGYAV